MIPDLGDRIAHRATITTVLELADRGLVEEAPAALYALGVRAPARYLEELRRKYPNVYAAADEQAGSDEPLGRAAMVAYVDDLDDLATAIRRLREDPVGELDRLGILDDLNPHAHRANVAEDVAEEKQDDYDHLVGESYPATRDARG